MNLDNTDLSFLNQLATEIIILDKNFNIIWLNDSALNKGWVMIKDKKNIIKNLKKLSSYKEVLVEKYIGGREIQVAIMGNKKLGVINLNKLIIGFVYLTKTLMKKNEESSL